MPGAGRSEEGALGCRGFAIEGKTAGTREEGAAGCWGICKLGLWRLCDLAPGVRLVH